MSSRPDNGFSAEERRAMLALARSAIVGALSNSPAGIPSPEPACFSLRRGLFVTVHVSGKLRGCIGVIEARETLRENIIHCAESAALHDLRFPSLRAAEIRDLQIEISILSELAPISPESIEVGRHGLFVDSGSHRGLLLPQVAVEHRLSREQFLAETCRKAGLPCDAWRRDETKLFGFSCEVFREDGPAEAAGW
jgi:AmmeMemoRadiSam system protein A